MAIQLTEKNGGSLLEVRVSGKLAHEDYQHFVPEFERLLKQNGKISVLFEMADFHGWDAAALWDDIKFDAKHFSDIQRLAMVGDQKWEKVMAICCKPFTTAKIRYFERGVIEEARAWLEAGTIAPAR
jgi:SpoIIAA-like